MSLTDRALQNVDSMRRDPRKLQRQWTDQWVEGIQEPTQHEDPRQDGILSQIHHGISTLYGDILDSLEDHATQDTAPMTKSLYRLLDDACDSFIEWGDDLRIGSGSLDESLKDSRCVSRDRDVRTKPSDN